jgi:hypothetical protein
MFAGIRRIIMRKFRRHWSHKVTKERRSYSKRMRRFFRVMLLSVPVPNFIHKLGTLNQMPRTGGQTLKMRRYEKDDRPTDI